MKFFNIFMMVVRILAVLIILLCGYIYFSDREDLKSLGNRAIFFLVIFVVIYFLGSSLQLLIRFRAAGRYKPPADEEDEDDDIETEDEEKKV